MMAMFCKKGVHARFALLKYCTAGGFRRFTVKRDQLMSKEEWARRRKEFTQEMKTFQKENEPTDENKKKLQMKKMGYEMEEQLFHILDRTFTALESREGIKSLILEDNTLSCRTANGGMKMKRVAVTPDPVNVMRRFFPCQIFYEVEIISTEEEFDDFYIPMQDPSSPQKVMWLSLQWLQESGGNMDYPEREERSLDFNLRRHIEDLCSED